MKESIDLRSPRLSCYTCGGLIKPDDPFWIATMSETHADRVFTLHSGVCVDVLDKDVFRVPVKRRRVRK